MKLSDRVKLRMSDLGLTPADVGRLLNKDSFVIRSLLTGRAQSFRDIPALAKALQTTPSWLLNGEGDKEATAKPNQQDEGEFDALCKKWLQNLQLTANITGTPLLAAAAHYAAIEAKGLPLTKENYTKVLEAMKRIYGEETNDGAGNQTTS